MIARDVSAAPTDRTSGDIKTLVIAIGEETREWQRQAADATTDVEDVAVRRCQAVRNREIQKMLAESSKIAQPDVTKPQRGKLRIPFAGNVEAEIDVACRCVTERAFQRRPHTSGYAR